MATIKVKFQPSKVLDNEGVIIYQISHKGRSRRLSSKYHVFDYEWSENSSTLIANACGERQKILQSIVRGVRRDVDRFSRVIHQLDEGVVEYTVDDIVLEFNRYTESCSLRNFMSEIIIRFQKNGKIRTSETYQAALNSFTSFLNDMRGHGDRQSEDIMLDSITTEIMENYECWQKRRGNVRNTVSFYNRILRAVYNRAVKKGIIKDCHPFESVYTGIDKTVKRALSIQLIKKIRNLDLSESPQLDYARDMFIMSFMLRGMSFIDMSYLRKTDLAGGHITYQRRKTGQQLTIGWTKEMQAIVDKYPENKSIYLLPIIKKPGVKERSVYRNAAYNINHNLKRIANILGIDIPLTLYVARHSWASAAKAKGIPLSVISEGMGHNSEAITQIYLSSLETSVIDKANNLILSSI